MKTNINKEYSNGSWKANKNFQNIINDTNIYKVIKFSTITTGLKFALATGNWGLKNNKGKQGIAQVLNRLTYNSTLSHLRRVNTPIEKTSKLVFPRKLHATQAGYMCPAETPEGASVGVVKNLALSCYITGYSEVDPVTDIISGLDKNSCKFLDELDGIMIGRLVQKNPFILLDVDSSIYNIKDKKKDKKKLVRQYFNYIKENIENQSAYHLLSPLLGMFFGEPGAKKIRQKINDLIRFKQFNNLEKICINFVS